MDGCATPSKAAWSGRPGRFLAVGLAALLSVLGADRALAQSAQAEVLPVYLHCSMGDAGEANCVEGFSANAIDGFLPQTVSAPQPVYPRALLNEETEGWVLVRFTISTEGTVLDPVVIGSEPPDSPFNEAALRTVSAYRFEPPVVDGHPLAVHDIAVRIVFSIADS